MNFGFLGGFFTVLVIKIQTDIHLMLYGFIGMASSVLLALAASYILHEKEISLDGLTIKTLKK